MLNPRRLYSLVLWLLLPYIFWHLIWRARKQPEYLHHIGERFGFYVAPGKRPIIWLHAVSVGETRATQTLVSRLRTLYPEHQILLTHTTPTGRAASEQIYADNVLRVYLPYDYPFAVQRFLRCFRPQLGILLETEIWFNLIHACQKNGTPLLLLNARMSQKSATRYARFARLTHNALQQLSGIAAQTTDDAARLTKLGAQHVSVMGNLKFDIRAPTKLLELGRQLRTQFGVTRKVFLAASTRDGEEAMLLDMLQKLSLTHLLLVIVPRHPQRFSAVAALLEQRGIRFQYRSENRAVAVGVQVLLGDSMGEMFAYYAAADIAFIGGSLLPYGGQNLIEACAVGTPVLIGPHTHNFAEATRWAVKAGAALQVKDSAQLAEELERLLATTATPAALHAMRLHCSEFVNAHRGATDKALRIIKPLLDLQQSSVTEVRHDDYTS